MGSKYAFCDEVAIDVLREASGLPFTDACHPVVVSSVQFVTAAG